MRPSECDTTTEGVDVLACQKVAEGVLWVKARVAQCSKMPHDITKADCSCTFTVEWLEGMYKGSHSVLTSDAVMPDHMPAVAPASGVPVEHHHHAGGAPIVCRRC
eukprot:CAMPEP_0182900100 /NCGR_PEP_ID=MMETSP0034_2-20130328/28573_1 /TAXON_ID=156128 /ORGANISM="Nephroselmis pyriformis, Strain CCMP717" /LENGTH=104 /DNA_ID=CAMNT_0025034235 /DNA_START=73 /DNA_END=384 /DNA_ORIENTATION=-